MCEAPPAHPLTRARLSRRSQNSTSSSTAGRRLCTGSCLFACPTCVLTPRLHRYHHLHLHPPAHPLQSHAPSPPDSPRLPGTHIPHPPPPPLSEHHSQPPSRTLVIFLPLGRQRLPAGGASEGRGGGEVGPRGAARERRACRERGEGAPCDGAVEGREDRTCKARQGGS